MAREILLRGSESAPNNFTLPNDSWWAAAGKINNMTLDLYALTSDTISAGQAEFQAAPTIEARIALADAACVSQGKSLLFIPLSMLPYNITLCPASAGVRRVREGGDSSLYDVLAYGAADNGTGNDAPAIQAAHDAIPLSGGTLVLSSNHRLATTLTFNKRLLVLGHGRSVIPGLGGSLLMKASTLNGPAIRLTGANDSNGSILSAFMIDGELGNGGDGIVIGTNYATCRDVTVIRQGRDGFRIGEDSATNVNLWMLDNCFALSNTRHGFNIDDPAGVPDANAGTMLHCDSSTNGGDGLRVGKARYNSFFNFTPQANTGAGVRLTAGSFQNGFYGGDWEESNTGGNLVIESGALRNTIMPAHLLTGITSGGTDTRFYLSSFHRDVTGGFATFANGDTTPSVAQFGAGGVGRYWQCGNSSPTSITDFDDGTDQQRMTVRLDGNTTIVNNSSLIRLKGAVNITGANANNFVGFLRLSNIWFEEYRNF